MRVLNGCLLLLAAGLAILLGTVGALAFFFSIAGSPDDPTNWFVVVASLVYALLLLATAALVITLKLPYRRVHEAPGGWIAIVGGMSLLLATPIIGGLVLGDVAEGSPGWLAGLTAEAAVEGAMFLVVVGGVRTVAFGVESLRLPDNLARVAIGGPGRQAEGTAGTVAAVPLGVPWLAMVDQRPRTRRMVTGAAAEGLSGTVILVLALVESARREGLGDTWWVVAWGALGLLSAIGLYVGFRPARVTSFVFSALTAILVALALAIGAGDPSTEVWQLIVGALLAFLGVVTLYGLGLLGRLTEWLTSS